jgi:hypothetical protein
MRTIGQLLMWVGFLSGALATVFYLPSDGVAFAKQRLTEAPAAKEVDAMGLPQAVAAHQPEFENSWKLIPWPWYGVSLAVCLTGVILIRLSKLRRAGLTRREAVQFDTIGESIESLVYETSILRNQVGKLAPGKIVQFIDGELADDLRTFAEGRESIIPRFGLAVYADVMTQFAAGERYINRAWSAAVDGYVDEAADCVKRAETHFKEARIQLKQAGQKHG